MKKVMVPLAEGFEEIEAITNIDVLKRAGIEVITAGLGSKEIEGDHGIKIETDMLLDEVDLDDLEAIVLPGGMPGAENLKNSDKLLWLISELAERENLVAAICAAPMVLDKAGVLKNKKATSYPGFDKEMPSCEYVEERVVRDHNVITGRGPGVAMEFALEVVRYLVGYEKVEELKEEMLINF
ncbi:MAG: DJ-1 family glyoxalase III [Bacillota bacterium]